METEKMKAQAGKLYDANYDAELLKEREICADITYELNRLRPSQTKERMEILRKLFGKTKGNFTIVSPFFCDYGYNIEIGENFFMNMDCVILDGAKVKFGDNVFVRRINGLEYALPITVGNNVWIGAHVCVLPGVSIGDNTVIGAGSVVTKNIPANVLAYGNPCKVIREITENDRT